METEKKIVRLLLEEKKAFTIRGMAAKIGSDYKIIHTAIQRLTKKNIIKKEKVGNSFLCKLNEKYYGSEIYEIEFERATELLKNKNIKILYDEIMSKIAESFFVFFVFGSVVKNKQRKASDIDLMFVTNAENFEKKADEILRTLPLKIHFLVFSEKEFKKMLFSSESNVVKEMLKSCIALYGIESYYRMLRC